MRPFLECRVAAGHFANACGNCKWRDHGIRCDAKEKNDFGDDGNSGAGGGGDGRRGGGGGGRALGALGSARNPLLLEDNRGSSDDPIVL